MALEDLSTLLWQEHELLDLLLFKAEEKQYMIVTNKVRWLPRIAAEIEVILDQLRALDIDRAAHVEAIGAEHDLGANPSLRQIAAAVGEPWAAILRRHQDNLMVVLGEIRTLSEANKDLIEAGLSALNESMHALSAPAAGTYTATGRQAATGPARAVTLDGTL